MYFSPSGAKGVSHTTWTPVVPLGLWYLHNAFSGHIPPRWGYKQEGKKNPRHPRQSAIQTTLSANLLRIYWISIVHNLQFFSDTRSRSDILFIAIGYCLNQDFQISRIREFYIKGIALHYRRFRHKRIKHIALTKTLDKDRTDAFPLDKGG